MTDWAKVDLGSPLAWPEALRTTVAICLGSQLPILIWWGPNLTLLHNDAAAEIVGPHALGKPGREVWAGVWSTLGPLIETVFASGIASWSEDVPLFVDREVAQREVYLSFSIGPILGKGGIPDGPDLHRERDDEARARGAPACRAARDSRRAPRSRARPRRPALRSSR